MRGNSFWKEPSSPAVRLSNKRFNLVLMAALHPGQGFTKLEGVIAKLQPAQKRDLVAVMWLGRGDFETWEAARRAADGELPTPLLNYLAEKYDLPDYLRRGWDAVPEADRETVVNLSAARLWMMRTRAEELLDKLDSNSLTADESYTVLSIYRHADDLRRRVAQRPELEKGWYGDKVGQLLKHTVRVADRWLEDHTQIREGAGKAKDIRWAYSGSLAASLSDVASLAERLMVCALEDEVDLFENSDGKAEALGLGPFYTIN